MKLGLSPSAAAELANPAPGQAAPLQGDLRPGHILDARFAITQVISHGGMATIFKAEDLLQGCRSVALKVPVQRLGLDPNHMPRFQREEEIGRRINHPYVMRFPRGVGKKSRPYLVMELLEGHTLYHELRKRPFLPEAEALRLAGQICEALQFVHERGVCHRDLKPENIMLCADGSIRLMDFGIARSDHSPRLTFVGFVPGTPHYMAPERVKCKRGDARTDIYGLGAMLYEMLTGVIAFDHEDPMVIMNARVTGDPEAPRRLNPAISPQAEEIVLRAMERNPDKRYQTAMEMKAALDAPSQVELTGRCDRLEPTTRARRFWRKARLIAPWILIPVAAQVVAFLLLWHHYSKK
ncbi:MAG: serine/threonine-protein kinase [Verrucomicrobiota bacterium]